MRLIEADGERAVEFQITKGQVALVDLDDWNETVRFCRWHAFSGKKGNTYYVETNSRDATRPTGFRREFLHKMLTGTPASVRVVHENRSGLDYRRKNFRIANQGQNPFNKGAQRNSATDLKCVYVCRTHGQIKAA